MELDPTTVADPATDIGLRVAAHRTRAGLKVSALARQIGVSPSLISQIERGQSRPSVSTLFATRRRSTCRWTRSSATATPARPSAAARWRLARRREPTAATSSAAATAPAIDIEGGVRWERLTPTQLDDLEFLELVYAPGAESHSALYRHPGMEMVLVLTGRLTIFVGFETLRARGGRQHLLPLLDARTATSTRPTRPHAR